MPGELRRIDDGKGGFYPPGGPPRRLAAILAADIAGYSRLMGIDEEGTHARVKRHRRELVDPTIAEHHGTLVKNTGDGFLAMFDSPVEAVRCAVVIQQSMIGRNASLPRPQWIVYRIGVNLGDVIVEPDDIYGDGVNIAARLENLAEPGAVYISGGVYEQIKNKLVCGYQSLGDQKVKNITDPVSVYRVLPDPAAVQKARHVHWSAAALAAVLAATAGVGGAGWYLYGRQPARLAVEAPQPVAQAVPPAAPKPAAAPPPPGSPPAGSPPSGSSPSGSSPVPPVSESPSQVAPLAPAPTSTPQVAAIAPPKPPARGPELVAIPGGSFVMGSSEDPSERPIHRVAVKPFAIGKFPVSVGEWKACVAARGCSFTPGGADDEPVANLSWSDAQQFMAWLSQATQQAYRLPTEAEWEYAARGGTATKYWWGNQMLVGMANCRGCNEPYDGRQPLKAGSFQPNPFGLYDMGGGIDQWVADCWHRNYQGAPADGSAWVGGDCFAHVLRGGSWRNDPSYVRTASRNQYDTSVRYPTHGFRVARSQ